MKYWIDVTSLPHVHFFRAFIKRAEKSGNEIFVTSRDFGIMNDILEQNGIDYASVGSHGGRDLEGKLVKSSERIIELAKVIKKENPDVGLSKHSVECARVCFGLGIPCVTVIDHETAEAAMRLMVPLSDEIVIPDVLSESQMKGFGSRNIRRFHGVCETSHFTDFRPSGHVLEEIGADKNDKIVIARTEPLLSSHNFRESIIFSVLRELKGRFPEAKMVFIPRGEKDRRMSKDLGMIVPEHSIDTLSLYSYASLMLGAGSCMNREAAVGGCPTISICPDRLPSVDRFLIEKGLIHHSLDRDEIVEKAAEMLSSREQEKLNGEIIKGFEDPYEKITEAADSLLK